jgi:PQQ-dependent dehydrogenase (methanol/ethanol family)
MRANLRKRRAKPRLLPSVFAAALCGNVLFCIQNLSVLSAAGTNEIDFARILAARPGDWLTYNGNLSGNRYSALSQINTSNVQKLVVKWTFPIPSFGLEATPLVADGVIYVSGANQAYSLDAATGQAIWRYSRPSTPGLVGDASRGTNRGVALLGDRIFMVTDNAHLIALNRITGRPIWETVMPDELQHYGSTVAPLVVKDLVVAGVSGGDWGMRGFVAAYKASSGERVWRFWTIPRNGEPGSNTWKGSDPKYGGGSTWLTGSYDPETDTLYWATGNPFPDADGSERSGDNLFTDSILALEPGNGKLKWHYQCTPHDLHDWDANQPIVLIDAKYREEPRKLLLQANRNGFFYVLDRANGQLLLGVPFVKTTWTSGLDAQGHPKILPAYYGNVRGEDLCPLAEATNYNAASYSPLTKLYYVLAVEKCGNVASSATQKLALASAEPGTKYLRALDIETGNVAWEIPQIGTTESKHWAGVLATAGGVLFYADPGGDVVSVDQQNGKPLWHFPTNEIIKSSPMTYTVRGKQFVALTVDSNIIAFGLP